MKVAVLLLLCFCAATLALADDHEEEVSVVEQDPLSARKLMSSSWKWCDPHDHKRSCGYDEWCKPHYWCKKVKKCKKVKYCAHWGKKYHKKYCYRYAYKYKCYYDNVCYKYACFKKRSYGYRKGGH